MPADLLPILHAGPGFVVVRKPAGITTEAYADHDTVEARAWQQFRRAGSPKQPFVGVVHRLDRPVSGVLVLARNKSTLRRLNQAFADRRVTKIYWARTQVPLAGEKQELVHDLVKNRREKRADVVTGPHPDAKRATLRYRLLKADDGGYLYELQPVSGRYHQLRAQLSAAGAPIVGDEKYGSPLPFRPHQIMLHAYQLTFPGADGTPLTVRCPPDW